MPIGPFANFDECVSKMLELHDEESAAAICGALKRDLEGNNKNNNNKNKDTGFPKVAATFTADDLTNLTESKKVLSFEDNGRLFLKIFLLDGSVNLNDWGVAPESIPQNIFSAIGKPLVIYRNLGTEHDAQISGRVPGEFDHPPLSEQDLGHALAYQDLFRVGTFIDVFESPITAEKNKWFGVAEITDENTKRAIREDPSIPFYVSPTIRLTEPAQPNQQVSHWQFMHSAVVDRPAYGVNKAFISGQCSGDKHTCLLQLRKASISKTGYGCGFCTYEAMKSILKEAQRYSGPNDADRPDSHFAYVPEEAKGADGSKSLRKFPIFDAPHVRNALARFSQANLPQNKKGEVLDNICRAAKKFDIESEVCEARSGSSNSSSSSSSSSNNHNINWDKVGVTGVGGGGGDTSRKAFANEFTSSNLSSQTLSSNNGGTSAVQQIKKAQEDEGLTEAEADKVEDLAEEIAEIVEDIQELTAAAKKEGNIVKEQRLQKLIEAVTKNKKNGGGGAAGLKQKKAQEDEGLTEAEADKVEDLAEEIAEIVEEIQELTASVLKTANKKGSSPKRQRLARLLKRAAKKKASKKLQKKAQENGDNGGLTEAEADRVDDLVDQILDEVQDLVEEAGETPAEGGALGELEDSVEETAENVQDLVEDIKALTAAKRNLESQLQKANLEKAQFNARISRLERDVEERDRQAKLNAITNLVSGSVMYQGLPAEEIQKQIDTYMNTGWSVDQIQQHIEPLEANFRRASSGGVATGYKTASTTAQTAAQPTTTRLPLGKLETRSASVQNTATENTAGNELPSFMRLATETFGRRYNSHSTSNAGGVQ